MLSIAPVAPASVQTRFALVSGPALEPVSPEEQESTLRVKLHGDRLDIALRITTARRLVERWTDRALISQQWDMWLDDFAAGDLPLRSVLNRPSAQFIEIPKPPLISVDSINTTKEDGTESAVATTVYWVSASKAPARVALRQGEVWPEHRAFDSFRIRFTAGYGTAADTVPAELRRAIALIAAMEKYPSDKSGRDGRMPVEIRDLLAPYRRIRL